MAAKKSGAQKAKSPADAREKPAAKKPKAAAKKPKAAAKKPKADPKAKARKAPAREPETGGMSVREAGRKGGLIGGKKGGETVKASRGIGFYKEIGRKGGQKVRELIEAGRAAMERREKRPKRK